MNPSAVAVIATLSSLYGPQSDRRMDRRQFFRVTGGAVGGIVSVGLLSHPLLQAAVLDRPEGLILAPSEVTAEPILFQTEMYDLARQFAMLCGQRWGPAKDSDAPLYDVGRSWRRRDPLSPWEDVPRATARRPVTVFVEPEMTPLQWDGILHPAVNEMGSKMLRTLIPSFTELEQLPRIASMDDPSVETGIAIDPVTGLTARASRALVMNNSGLGGSTQTIVQLEIIGRQWRTP